MTTAPRRATAPARTATPRPPPPRGGGTARPKPGGRRTAAVTSPPGWRARWLRVTLLVLAVLVGLPLAHALWGEVVALLGGAVLFGFWLGRWTAPR